MDNISGYKEIELVHLRDVAKFEETKKTIRIEFSGVKKLVSIPFQKTGTSISVESSREDAGLLYANEITILIPKHLANDEVIEFIDNVHLPVLLRFTDLMDNTYIIGGKEYPLLFTKDNRTPNSAATLNCYALKLSGKATYPQRLEVE